MSFILVDSIRDIDSDTPYGVVSRRKPRRHIERDHVQPSPSQLQHQHPEEYNNPRLKEEIMTHTIYHHSIL